MNKDKLEQFIIDRRDAFNDQEPPKMAWEGIQKKLPKNNKIPRRVSLWKFTRIAASVAFLLAIGFLMGRQSFTTQEVAGIEEQFPEFLEAKSYYEYEVDEKLTRLASYSYDTSIEEDMSQLDDFMEELKEELEEAPKGAEEQIINAMITNYQTKLDILEKVLESVESTNQVNDKLKDDEVNI